jgi:4-hydroxy-4-methyl-2-oxoglutarate aldolase
MHMKPLRPETLKTLRGFDTPTICNVIELFDIRPRNTGYMDDRIKACFPELPPIVGFAATATFRSSAPARSPDGYADLVTQVERFSELSGPPIVVFQDVDNPPAAATFGEIMCTSYQTFGAVGLITSGAGRDLDQVHRIGFPVFTSGAICAHGYVHIPQIHVPVHVGGILIYPDDLLHADCNGVTTIPIEIADEVADAAPEFFAAEDIILECLHQPNASISAFAQARADSQEKIRQLHARLTRQR